jgi:hypothetical protein
MADSKDYRMNRLLRFVIIIGGVVLLNSGSAIASVCDLTTDGSSCGPIFNGAIFGEVSPQPTGTGNIDSFLRLQKNGIEQGYNTSARPFEYDQKEPINYTHDIQLKDVPVVTIDGVEYREFYLDINEADSAGKELISLDELRIYLKPGGALTDPDYNPNNKKLSNLTAVYDMDGGLTGGQDNWIKLNYSLNNGSGSGDMVAYIPNSLFTGSGDQFLYLYSKFGVQTGMQADDGSDAGFEEWWLKKQPSDDNQNVPEPSLLALLGMSAALAVRRRVTRKTSSSEKP